MIARHAPQVALKKSRVRRNLRVTRRGRMMASNASQMTMRKIARPAAKTPGAGIMCALYSLRRLRRNKLLGNERGGNRDFCFEELGNGAAGFGVLYCDVEFGLVGAWDFCDEIEMAFGNREAVPDFLE